MSKNSQPATQTQSVEIPAEFKAWIFGPGMYGGTPGGGSSSGFISKDVHNFHKKTGHLFGDPLNLVKKKSPGAAAQFMDAGFEGILPMALKLAQTGELNPATIMSDTTKEAMSSSRALIDMLNASFLPGAQSLFDKVSSRDLVNAKETQDVIASSTRPIMEELARYAVPATQDAAIAAGQLGSSRQGIAEGLARSEANKTIGDISSRISYQAMQDQMANEKFALQFAPTMLQLLSAPTTLLSELGQQQEAYDLESRAAKANNLNALAALLQGFIPGASTTQTQTKGKTGNEKLGGAISGASAGSAFGPWGAAIGGALGALMG